VNYSHRSRLGIRSGAALLLCTILTSLPVGAESVLDSVPTIDNISSRLELTPEQEAKLRPIFANRLSELQLTQLHLDQATTPQQKDEVLRDAKKAADNFNSQVESVLTPSQRNEWREIRSQIRETVRESAEEKSPLH